MSRATPEMIAAAWAAWHSRHGGKLGPGPAFIEAINAALGKMEPAMTQQEKTSNPAHVSQMTGPADQIISQIEELFPNWRAYRDLVDCITCELHELRQRAEGK
jgi:hypothetical protein